MAILPRESGGGRKIIEEREDTDPTDYVVFPWEFALRYHERARLYVEALPGNESYEMLSLRDTQDRREWGYQPRTKPTLSLGQIAARVYELNSKNWEFTPVDKAATWLPPRSRTDATERISGLM